MDLRAPQGLCVIFPLFFQRSPPTQTSSPSSKTPPNAPSTHGTQRSPDPRWFPHSSRHTGSTLFPPLRTTQTPPPASPADSPPQSPPPADPRILVPTTNSPHSSLAATQISSHTNSAPPLLHNSQPEFPRAIVPPRAIDLALPPPPAQIPATQSLLGTRCRLASQTSTTSNLRAQSAAPPPPPPPHPKSTPPKLPSPPTSTAFLFSIFDSRSPPHATSSPPTPPPPHTASDTPAPNSSLVLASPKTEPVAPHTSIPKSESSGPPR